MEDDGGAIGAKGIQYEIDGADSVEREIYLRVGKGSSSVKRRRRKESEFHLTHD